MKAAEKEHKVTWAVNKMRELAEEGDTEGVDRVNARAYDWARGSNERKDRLKAGHKAALAELEPDPEEDEGPFVLVPALAAADALVTEFARTLEALAAAHPEHDDELTDLASRVHMARLEWAQEHDQS